MVIRSSVDCRICFEDFDLNRLESDPFGYDFVRIQHRGEAVGCHNIFHEACLTSWWRQKRFAQGEETCPFDMRHVDMLLPVNGQTYAQELMTSGDPTLKARGLYISGVIASQNVVARLDGQSPEAVAFRCYLEAAELGHPQAQYRVGRMHHLGTAIPNGPPNYPEAAKWYKLAADQGIAAAGNRMGLLYLEAHFDSIDGQPNYAKAVEWFEKAADQGIAAAGNKIGLLYLQAHFDSIDGQPNYAKAAEWFEKAATQGDADARNNLGILYFEGHVDGQPNYAKAAKWYEMAADQGIANARHFMGFFHYRGYINGQPDYAKAIFYYEKASDLGHEPSRNALDQLKQHLATLEQPRGVKRKPLEEAAALPQQPEPKKPKPSDREVDTSANGGGSGVGPADNDADADTNMRGQ